MRQPVSTTVVSRAPPNAAPSPCPPLCNRSLGPTRSGRTTDSREASSGGFAKHRAGGIVGGGSRLVGPGHKRRSDPGHYQTHLREHQRNLRIHHTWRRCSIPATRSPVSLCLLRCRLCPRRRGTTHQHQPAAWQVHIAGDFPHRLSSVNSTETALPRLRSPNVTMLPCQSFSAPRGGCDSRKVGRRICEPVFPESDAMSWRVLSLAATGSASLLR